MGVDGSGKSTIVKLLKAMCDKSGKEITHLHWRPNLLPSPRRFYGGKPTYDTANPHSNALHGFITTFFLLIYYFIDFWLGYIYIIRPSKKRGGLVIFERYYYDLLTDPRRYRLKPIRLSKALSRFVPRPDTLIILHAEPHILFERKCELTIEEIERQQLSYKKLIKKELNLSWFDVGKFSAQEIANALI